MCCAADEEQARKTAHRYHRWSLAGWPVLAELPHDEAFAAASEHVSVETIGKEISCGPSADRHLEAIHELTAIGCDHIILTQIGPDQDFFFELFERKPGAGVAREEGGVEDWRFIPTSGSLSRSLSSVIG